VPLYDYECLPNKHRFELRQSINDDPLRECTECGGPVRRVIHPVGVVFKGSGFYVTDSRKSTSLSKSSPAKSEDGKSDGNAKSDSSGELKAEPKGEGRKESAAS
jgi:putative FmdB family regulatory protein